MKHIRKFNESKKEDKVEDQEVLFNAEVLVDKDEKPSFKTSEEEDQEKIKKEFDKLRKVKSFENFTIEVEVGVKPEGEEHEQEPETLQDPVTQELGCGCCDDCTCGSDEEVEEINPETDVKVMNIADFMNSLDQ
jgi:hypothetical protein